MGSVALATLALAGCSGLSDNAPPVATPSLALARPSAAINGPMEMTYRFVVAADAPAFTEDYRVFVHFLDSDDELMWTDDHDPPTPTRQWKAGATVEYPRTVFVPKFPYVGQTQIEIGLYSPTTGDRLPLAGQTRGQRSYRAATFDLRLVSDEHFVVFGEGWHDTELANEGAGREWQWSKKQATLSFRNPRRDVRFYLHADQPAAIALAEPQRVEIRIGPNIVDSFTVPLGDSALRRIDLTASQLGSGDTVEMVLSVDRTFVPADVPAMQSNDPRELGIRVFRAFVEPK
jgi:hypothetical protein